MAAFGAGGHLGGLPRFGRRRINIRAQLVARYPGQGFDGKNAPDRDFGPLTDRGIRNADGARERPLASKLFLDLGEDVRLHRSKLSDANKKIKLNYGCE